MFFNIVNQTSPYTCSYTQPYKVYCVWKQPQFQFHLGLGCLRHIPQVQLSQRVGKQGDIESYSILVQVDNSAWPNRREWKWEWDPFSIWLVLIWQRFYFPLSRLWAWAFALALPYVICWQISPLNTQKPSFIWTGKSICFFQTILFYYFKNYFIYYIMSFYRTSNILTFILRFNKLK